MFGLRGRAKDGPKVRASGERNGPVGSGVERYPHRRARDDARLGGKEFLDDLPPQAC
jgi:hypothetical protein